MTKILAALQLLDPKNDNHWTSDGLPRLETVRLHSGDSQLTREAVTAAVPGFTRAKAPLQAPLQAAESTSPEQGTHTTVLPAPAAPRPVAQAESGDVTSTQGSGDDAADDQTEPAGAIAQNSLQAAAGRVKAASEAKAKADQEYSQAVAAQDAEIDAATRAGTQETLAQQVGFYHQRQLAALQQRGEQQQRLRSANIDLKALIPQRSNLDSALSRKTGRGGQRPNLPLRK